MDPKHCGGGKRLPRIAASLIMRLASEREPSFFMHKSGLRLPPTPPTPPGLEFGDFSYSSVGSKPMSPDSLDPAPPGEPSPSGLPSAGGQTVTPLTFVEDDDDDDSGDECLSLESLKSPSERDDFLPGQGDTAESSPKRGKKTGGDLVLYFYVHFIILMSFINMCICICIHTHTHKSFWALGHPTYMCIFPRLLPQLPPLYKMSVYSLSLQFPSLA